MEFLIYNLDNMFERFFVFLKNRNIIYELFFMFLFVFYDIRLVMLKYIIVLKFYVYIRFLLWEKNYCMLFCKLYFIIKLC